MTTKDGKPKSAHEATVKDYLARKEKEKEEAGARRKELHSRVKDRAGAGTRGTVSDSPQGGQVKELFPDQKKDVAQDVDDDYVEVSQRGAFAGEEETESERYKAQGLAAAKGTGIASAKFEAIDDAIQRGVKFNEVYDIYVNLFNNLLGGEPDLANEVQNLKATVGDDLLKDFPMELVQMKSEKYNQAQGLARVAVMSMMGGMMQTMTGAQGSVPTAGIEGMSMGIESIQERRDRVDKFNMAVDEKNADLAREYYLKADQWAKDYNQIYTQMEQIKNKFAIDAVNDERKHWATLIEEIGKTVRALSGDEATDTKSKRDSEKARMQSQASIDIERSRAKRDTAKLYLGLSRDTKVLEENGMFKVGDLDEMMALSDVMGLSPGSTAISIASFWNYRPRNDEEVYRLKQISGSAEAYAGQIFKAADVAASKSWSILNPFSWGRGKEAKAELVNFMTTTAALGINFDEAGLNRIANSYGGDGFTVNQDMDSFQLITNDPAIKDMLRGGQMTRPTDLESLKNHLNELAEMRAMAMRYGRNDVVVNIDSYSNRLVGGITADGQPLGGFIDEHLTGWSGASNKERQLHGGAVNYHVLNRLAKEIDADSKKALEERVKIQGKTK